MICSVRQMPKSWFLYLLIVCCTPYLLDVVTCEEASSSPLYQSTLVENADPTDDDRGSSHPIASELIDVGDTSVPARIVIDNRLDHDSSAEHQGLVLTPRPPPLA